MILGFDFETYYDTEYSLTKMDPPSYILDARYETIGCSFKEDDHPAFFVDAPDISKYVDGLHAETTTTYAFNALFDNSILAWRYNFVPGRILCTMRMAVALHGAYMPRHSLRAVGEFLKVGVKGTIIESARGLNRAALMAHPQLWRDYQDYANNDNEMNSGILLKCLPDLPLSERRVMDQVLRCAVQPRFVMDVPMLQQHLVDLDVEKQQMLWDAGCPRALTAAEQGDANQAFSKQLRSGPKFEELLKSLGVDVQYKQSMTNPEVKIPAFAKTDDFMAELQEHVDPHVQALACARLGLRSTIEETRGKRMLNIATLPWATASYRGGKPLGTMPLPLKYSAAHTHRLGGEWKYNPQNLPSGRGLQKSKLRTSLKAPDGYKVVVADKSQIECRINAKICGQMDLLQLFATGGDPYSVLGTKIFGYPVDKKTNGGIPRFIGKGGELGLGFGCGDSKFYTMVVRQARTLGMNMPQLLAVWTEALAIKSVQTYRRSHHNIVSAWSVLDGHIRTSWVGLTDPVKWGPVVIGCGYVEGPNGLFMRYANPRWDPETYEFLYDYAGRVHRMYGPKFLENIVQFLARINTMNDALRIKDRTGYTFALQSHDELVWIVPEAKAQWMLDIALEEMKRPPSWARDLPLGAEGGFGDSYADAK